MGSPPRTSADLPPDDVEWGEESSPPSDVEWGPEEAPQAQAATSTKSPMPVPVPDKGAQIWATLKAAGEASGLVPRGVVPDGRTARGALATGLNGYALQWADELAGQQAEQETALENIRGLHPRGEQVDPRWAYRNGRDKFRAIEADFRAAHPAAAFALSMGGSMMNPVGALASEVTGPMAAAPWLAPRVLWSAPATGAARLIPTAADAVRYAPAAVEGAISGAGSTDEAEGMGEAAAIGAPLSAAGQMAGEVVGSVAQAGLQGAGAKIQDAAARYAARRALAASGYIQKDLKPIMRRDPSEAIRMGQGLLDEPGIIRAGQTVGDVADNLEPALADAGQQIGVVLKQADATGARYDVNPFLQGVEDEILTPIRGDPVVAREVAEIDRIVDGYRALAASKGGLTFTEANAMKTRLQGMEINWGNFFNDISPSRNAQQYKVHLQNLFLNSIDDQIGAATSPDIEAAFKVAKGRYGLLHDAIDKARQGRARMEGNKQFSITDYLAAIGGATTAAATGDVKPLAFGVGAAMANKVVRERGPTTGAVLGNAVAQMRGSLPSMSVPAGELGAAAERTWRAGVERGDQKSTSAIVEALATQNPEALGPYAQQIQQAAADGNLPLVHYTLQQTDPKYRAMIEAARTGGTE